MSSPCVEPSESEGGCGVVTVGKPGRCLWAGNVGEMEFGGVGSMPECSGTPECATSRGMEMCDDADCAAKATEILEGLLTAMEAMLEGDVFGK